MTTPDQRANPATSPEHFLPEKTRWWHTPRQRLLMLGISTGALGILLLGIATPFVLWLGAPHVARLWLQGTATLLGSFLLVILFVVPQQRHLTQWLVGFTGVLLISTVYDSLDGVQDALPVVTFLLWVWVAVHLQTLLEVWQVTHLSLWRKWLAIALGIVATGTYLGTAGYYLWLNWTSGPIIINQHPLYGLAIIASTLVQVVGGVYPRQRHLRGAVRSCPTCGLPNIAERHTCKRCGIPLTHTPMSG